MTEPRSLIAEIQGGPTHRGLQRRCDRCRTTPARGRAPALRRALVATQAPARHSMTSRLFPFNAAVPTMTRPPATVVFALPVAVSRADFPYTEPVKVTASFESSVIPPALLRSEKSATPFVRV